jgi:hypothetical protein
VVALGCVDIFVCSERGVDHYFHIPMSGPPDGWRKVWFFLRNDTDAIGKTKLFTIGVSATATSALPIKYVIKKFFDIDPSTISNQLQDVQVIFMFLLYNLIVYITYLF